MSRSYIKQPFFSIRGENRSEKKDKQIWHKAFRKNIKQSIHHAINNHSWENYITPVPHEVMTVYDMSKEYRPYYEDAPKKLFRK